MVATLRTAIDPLGRPARPAVRVAHGPIMLAANATPGGARRAPFNLGGAWRSIIARRPRGDDQSDGTGRASGSGIGIDQALGVAALATGGAATAVALSSPTPVVLVHGILDCAENMERYVARWVRKALGAGAYVLAVEIGNGVMDSITRSMDWQLNELVDAVRSDNNLERGFNLIGYSQGALLARAYVQRHNDPPVFKLVSWVGPQAGQFGVPEFEPLLAYYNKLTSAMWYTPAVQARAASRSLRRGGARGT